MSACASTAAAGLTSLKKGPRLFTGVPSLKLPFPEVPSSLSEDPEACTSSFPLPSHPGLLSAYHPKAHECSFQPGIPDSALHEIGTGRRLPQVRSLHIHQRRLSLVNYPPPTHTLRGGGFVPLTRTQGRHLPAVPFHRDYFCDSSDPHSGYLYRSWLSLCHTGTRSPSPPDRYSRYTSCRY